MSRTLLARKSALAGRRRLKSFAILLVLGSCLVGVARAQSPLTFERALQLALAHHPTVMGKRSEQAATLAEKQGAEWARYPTPTLEATTRTTAGANTGLLRVDQPLWTGGRITAGIEAATSRYDSATVAIEESQLDIAIRIIAAYVETLRQKDREGYALEGVREHEKLLDMISRRVTQEVSSQADRRLAESRLLQAQSDLSLVQQAFNNGLTQLTQLSGENVTDVTWRGFEIQKHPVSLEAALNTALTYSPTLRRISHGEDAANADIDAKRSAYWPQLTMRLEHATGGLNPDSRAMLVLTAQPGAGLSAGAGVDAAIARRDAVRQTRTAAEREVRERVMIDWNDWQTARTRLDAAQRTSEISNEVFESYARQYVIGRKTWIDVLNAVRESTLARFSLAEARAQTAAAALRLRAWTGTLVSE